MANPLFIWPNGLNGRPSDNAPYFDLDENYFIQGPYYSAGDYYIDLVNKKTRCFYIYLRVNPHYEDVTLVVTTTIYKIDDQLMTYVEKLIRFMTINAKTIDKFDLRKFKFLVPIKIPKTLTMKRLRTTLCKTT